MKEEENNQLMTAEQVLMKIYNAEDTEELQMSITVNPQLKFIIEAMEEYAEAKATPLQEENNIQLADKNQLKVLQDLMEDLPVDWLGTGGIGSTPDKDADEWRAKWDKAYKEAIQLQENKRLKKSLPIECYVKVSKEEAEKINYNVNAAHNLGWISSPEGWLKKVTISLPATPMPVSGMRWVGCSERPKKTGFYCVKRTVVDSKGEAVINFSGTWFANNQWRDMLIEEKLHQFEWLDEGTTPVK